MPAPPAPIWINQPGPENDIVAGSTPLFCPPGELELTPMDVLRIAIGTLADVDYALEEGVLLIRRR
jgi:hypothetical protein